MSSAISYRKKWNGVGFFCLLILSIVVATYNALYAFSYYPITEGWFSEYAILLRSGKIPHVDFHVLLSPLYPLIIALVQSIFGEAFLWLRLLGILITVGICFSLFWILKNLFGHWPAAISALVSVIYYQSGNAYVGYDFTQFLTLFLLIGGGLLTSAIVLRMEDVHQTKSIQLRLFLSGLFFGLAILIKHSNAAATALIFTFASAIIAVRVWGWRDAFRLFWVGVLGFLIPLVLMSGWLAYLGAFSYFLRDLFIDAAAAKGGISTILTGWIKDFFLPLHEYVYLSIVSLTQMIGLIWFSLFLALPKLISKLPYSRKTSKRSLQKLLRSPVLKEIELSDIIVGTIICGLGLLTIFNIYFDCKIGWPEMSWVFDLVHPILVVGAVNLCLVGFIILITMVMLRASIWRVHLCLIFSFGISLIIGNGTSGGLSEISAFFGYSLFLAIFFREAARFGPSILPIAMFAISMSCAFINARYEHPYEWWAISAENNRKAVCAPTEGLFANICLTADQNDKQQRIKSLILAHSAPGDEIYVYPHMPVFYMMTGRTPFRGAVVSWFDFMSDNQALALAHDLSNRPPKVIIAAELPERVTSAHEQLFRANVSSGQRQIAATINGLEQQGTLCRIDAIPNVNGVDINVLVPCQKSQL